MNSGVRVKGSCYGVDELDFYGMVTDIIKLQYFGTNNSIVLFQCDWYDSDKGVKIDSLHGLVDIKYRSRLASNEPFILASQPHQVYYARYPHRRRNAWWAICNMKARNNYNFSWHENPIDNVQKVDDDIFQEVELHVPTPVSVGADLDIPRVLLGDGLMEEVNLNDITVPRFSDDDQLDKEEYAKNDEWENDDENDNVELDVDNEEVGFEYESNDDMEDD
ncbi:Transposon, En/Spm-like protein [Quillaja saponaria]|uniref:Transposon, En/Spm-like protein n=1 Tax=Quillaja saponaria TaxID=32244 RepID=A0AAD7Q859_QUISA|nr:Transposon, En/Spm-like protein [Quillaja saponaria]